MIVVRRFARKVVLRAVLSVHTTRRRSNVGISKMATIAERAKAVGYESPHENGEFCGGCLYCIEKLERKSRLPIFIENKYRR